mgnify:CR=1 FL=1
MAQTFEVDVSGFQDLFKKFDDMSEEIGKGKTDRLWRGMLLNSMQTVFDDAKAFAPGESSESTGQLRDSIYMAAHKPKARDKSSVSYNGEMYMVRVTSSPIRRDTKYKVMVNKKGNLQTVSTNKKPVAVSQEFGNKHLINNEFGTADKGAHPFLRPALDNNRQEVMNRLAQIMWYELFMGKYAKKE